jgi:hypothetical protein
VFDAHHLILRRSGSALYAFGATGRAGPREYREMWAGAGVVIEARSGQPFTSDYDLAAVIPAQGFDYLRDVAGFQIGKSYTSELAEKTRADLNRDFGSARFRHGPQALFDHKLSHKDSEHIVAFCANGDVYTFRTPATEDAAALQYRDLLIALHPDKKHVFNQ